MDTDAQEVQRLRNHLVGAVQRALRMCNGFTLLVEDDVPSSVLAALARDQSDVPFSLLHVARGPDPPLHARTLAKRLGLSLIERHVTRQEESRVAAELASSGLASNPGLVRFAMAADEARLHGARLLLARGADDVLSPRPGEDPSRSPDRGAEERMASATGLQLRYPFLDKGVVPYLARLADDASANAARLRSLDPLDGGQPARP